MSVQTGDTAMSPLIKSFVAGSLSGTCSTLILQPLDLVKTRLQRDKTLHGGRSQGVLNIYRNVVKNEGVFALWKGLTPALLRCVPGLGLYFCTLTALQSNLSSPTPTSLQILTIGATARSLSVITLLPFTVIKTRLESGVYKYSGVVNALMTIYKTEGPRGLYSGILATLVRDVPFSSLYLLLYTRAKKLVSAGM
ncbi:SLC25A38 [Bugula neritina]|uniref:SLC25A38 n=1 Tax=Bugula neritina TaxID=10212 RepID=A0A7J7K5A9_BUGNE|nr:SLC25A38 [Bugula neritina]